MLSSMRPDRLHYPALKDGAARLAFFVFRWHEHYVRAHDRLFFKCRHRMPVGDFTTTCTPPDRRCRGDVRQWPAPACGTGRRWANSSQRRREKCPYCGRNAEVLGQCLRGIWTWVALKAKAMSVERRRLRQNRPCQEVDGIALLSAPAGLSANQRTDVCWPSSTPLNDQTWAAAMPPAGCSRDAWVHRKENKKKNPEMTDGTEGTRTEFLGRRRQWATTLTRMGAVPPAGQG